MNTSNLQRPLTKSRFKLASQCSSKLFYTGKSEYENTQTEDAFLEALAEGGFQVGELAKYYHPDGVDITESGYEKPLKRTTELLQQENVTIYEAAIRFENFFIRVDVLEKVGNTVNLIEVKAKSFNGNGPEDFLGARNQISSAWRPYLEDIAFQTYVYQKAFPEHQVNSYLMLADKSKTASVKGLNQKFKLIKTANGRTGVEVEPELTQDALGNPVLSKVQVNHLVRSILHEEQEGYTSFEEKVNTWTQFYANDKKLKGLIGTHCFGCEFRGSNKEKKSGFHECWKEQTHLTDTELAEPMLDAIWNWRGKKKVFEDGRYLLREVEEWDLTRSQPKSNGALSVEDRQRLQLEKFKNKDDHFYLNINLLRDEMEKHEYPLHFIDFETAMVAIPFYEGQRPYEQIAFQFSHHIMQEDGSVKHASQFIEIEPGVFPNFNFLRELKNVLENDNGTIFRYAAHENTVINQILEQLRATPTSNLEDKQELIQFAESISHRSDRMSGARDMVDLKQLVQDTFYHPLTNGSNSIKAVLPAVLNSSAVLKERYAAPIYGKNGEVKSLNFENQVWIKYDEDGNVTNPYTLLPPVFTNMSNDEIENRLLQQDIKEGGSALVAFAKMQFTEMTTTEREQIVQALYRYCELDTLAMVFIYEFFLEQLALK